MIRLGWFMVGWLSAWVGSEWLDLGLAETVLLAIGCGFVSARVYHRVESDS